MKIPGIVLCLAVLSLRIFPEGFAENLDFIREERVISDSDPLYGLVERQILIRGKNDSRLWEIKNIFTAFSSEQNGIGSQTDVYLGTEAPVRYDFNFTEAFSALSGFSGRVDHVEGDRISRVDLYPVDMPVVSLSGEEAETLSRFPLRRLSFYADVYARPIPASDGCIVETPLFGSSACVIYEGMLEDLSTAEKTLLRRWAILHNAPGFEEPYGRKLLVSERGRSFGVCIRNDFEIFSAGKLPLFIRYYYTGSCADGPQFVATSIRKPDGES